MKGTRGISLWLLAVYLVATAALSVAALTCECAVHAGGGDSACCTHCPHHVPEHDGALTGACCCDLHSMESSLYVAQLTGAAERTQRLAATDLPPALNGEPLRPAEMPWWRPAAAERSTGALPEAALAAAGLRAPPVWA